jgi:DNA-binding MarR family transcriptional regulator
MATKAARRQAIEDRANDRAKAMQHPLRRDVLLCFTEHEELSPSEIAEKLDEDVDQVSYHVKRLEKLGCVELVREEKVRGAVKHYYRNIERHLIDTDEWEDIDPLRKDELLVSFFQPFVDDFNRGASSGTLGGDEKFHITRTPMRGIDLEGFDDLLALKESTRLKALEIQAESAARRAKSGEPPICVSSTLSCFKVPGF